MLAAGFLIIFAGYSVGSWGMCLLKGYDITFREWVNPLNPFQWSTVTFVPANQILPGSAVNNGAPVPGAPGSTPTGGASIGVDVQNAVQDIQNAIRNGSLG